MCSCHCLAENRCVPCDARWGWAETTLRRDPEPGSVCGWARTNVPTPHTAPVGDGPTHTLHSAITLHSAMAEFSHTTFETSTDSSGSGTASSGRTVIKVYVTPSQKERIQNRARRVNRSMSEYLQTAGLHGGPGELLEVLVRVDLRMLNVQLRDLLERMETSRQAPPMQAPPVDVELWTDVRDVVGRIGRALKCIEETHSTENQRGSRLGDALETGLAVESNGREADAVGSNVR